MPREDFRPPLSVFSSALGASQGPIRRHLDARLLQAQAFTPAMWTGLRDTFTIWEREQEAAD